MFLFANRFFEQLMNYRVLWARSHVGSGKTLVCTAICDHLLRTGDFRGVVSNIPHKFPVPKDGTLFDCVCMLDEAHLFIDSRTFGSNNKEYGGLARHCRSIWLFPSVWPVDVRNRCMWVERSWRLGTLAWGYYGGVDLGYTQENFAFVLWRPSEYFTFYDTAAIPSDDGGLSVLWARTSEQLKARTRERMQAIYREMGIADE